jgi:hypothetical protein
MTPRQPGTGTGRAWTTATGQARQAGISQSLTRMPRRRQNTQICGPQETNANGRPAVQKADKACRTTREL